MIARALVSALVAAILIPVPAASASEGADMVVPGVSIFQNDPAGGRFECSSGFVVKLSDGTPGILTAGHCSHGPSVPVTQFDTSSTEHRVGYYVRAANDDTVMGADIGLISVQSDLPVRSGLWGRVPVEGILTAEDARSLPAGEQVCKIGAKTQFSCGPVTEVRGDKVFFRADDTNGDSGSPVFVPAPDGKGVYALGVLVRGTGSSDGSGTIEAQTIAPYLRAWGVKLVITQQ
ncbi:trypsin-like serine protease [Segniliparus rugosus]|uniref:Peptidase S1 domain-containing protein n=1 Tax=Segniliparus rugosus (strain ATCC BAA-974 / DSM 45345 / CCUG 50838 / CIP 108380 / JCM 13579 / CDC 945) TaxID=679197 RepID=E5XT58_SEGRC|nr:trypsin-like serine protease [Segniliparus rugosus]EFV12469.1 hypothetical protein HMPREF9336_02680 [Segniliparus rugosus ATCC BAA-974]